MDVNKLYEEKQLTVEQGLSKIKSNDNIITGLAAAEPQQILSQLHTIADRVENVTISNCLPMQNYPFFIDAKYKGSFLTEGWFYSPGIRKMHGEGNVSFIPNHLHFAGEKRLYHRPCNVFLGTATPMDKHGYLSLSLSATYEKEVIQQADLVILEVNPNIPRTFGDTTVHISDIDHVIEVNYPAPELPAQQPSEKR